MVIVVKLVVMMMMMMLLSCDTRSTSVDPRAFKSSGSNFKAGQTYNFTVNVTDDTGQFISGKAYVYVRTTGAK